MSTEPYHYAYAVSKEMREDAVVELDPFILHRFRAECEKVGVELTSEPTLDWRWREPVFAGPLRLAGHWVALASAWGRKT